VTAPARIYLDVPQANPPAQQALQEFRGRQPLHLWVDDGLIDGVALEHLGLQVELIVMRLRWCGVQPGSGLPSSSCYG
jgi:hypothetical protein